MSYNPFKHLSPQGGQMYLSKVYNPPQTQTGNNMGAAGAAAINFGSEVASTLINQAFAEHNRKRNYYWNEKSADAADARQRKQYEDYYSPKAMLEQYKEAGLSPSMMMGGSSTVGQGHAGGAQGAGAGGIQGPYMSAVDLSQIELNKALAFKAKSEGEVTKETGKELTLSQIASNLANAGKADAEKEVLQIDKAFKQVGLNIAKATQQGEIDKVFAELDTIRKQAEKLYYETEGQMLKNSYDATTFGQRVEQLALENINLFTSAAERFANIELTQAQIKKMAQDVAVAWYNADTSRMDQAAQQKFFEEQVKQWGIENNIAQQNVELRGKEEHNEDVRNWTSFATSILHSLCMLGGMALNAVK